jgi:hypothetical protein
LLPACFSCTDAQGKRVCPRTLPEYKHFEPSHPFEPLTGKNNLVSFEAPPSRSWPLLPLPLEAHDATETETKKLRHQNSKARPRNSDDASLGMPMASSQPQGATRADAASAGPPLEALNATPRGQTAHLLNYRKPTAMAAKQEIHAPPRRPENELTLLQPHSPALRIIQKCPSANAAATQTTKATKHRQRRVSKRRRRGGYGTSFV